MCGIAGVIGGTRKFNMNHRGYSSGEYINEDISLYHRRLSLVGGEEGSQPIENERYVMVSNHEIYNYKNLALELGLQTESDTVVFLQGYTQYQESFFSMINGSFACAIWDKKEKELTLARDRYGIRPLFYHKNMFASEAMMLPMKENKEAVEQCRKQRIAPNGVTCFTDTYHLPGGFYKKGEKVECYLRNY